MKHSITSDTFDSLIEECKTLGITSGYEYDTYVKIAQYCDEYKNAHLTPFVIYDDVAELYTVTSSERLSGKYH